MLSKFLMNSKNVLNTLFLVDIHEWDYHVK